MTLSEVGLELGDGPALPATKLSEAFADRVGRVRVFAALDNQRLDDLFGERPSVIRVRSLVSASAERSSRTCDPRRFVAVKV